MVLFYYFTICVVERDLISQCEMAEDLSEVGILLICRVPLDRVNRLYLGVMESVQSMLEFMGFTKD